jgi:hypothetical protein
MNGLLLICFVVLLCLLVVHWSEAAVRKNDRKKEKPAPVKQKPLRLNVDILPPLQDVLKELELDVYLKNFVKMGVTETRLLLRLSGMDFQIMEMDWPDFTPEMLKKLKDKIKVLLEMATVVEIPENPDLELRKKQKYGRVYIENGVQSFEFNLASFGGVPPIGKQQLVLSHNLIECNSSHTTNYHKQFVLAMRGNCTFLEKALNALSNNATGMIVVNTEDKLESPASGVGIDRNITEEMVQPLANFPLVSISNTSWEPLNKAIQFNQYHPLPVHIVPLKCRTGGQCLPLLKEEKEVQAEVSWGRLRVRKGKTSKQFEFLTSNFGAQLPVDKELPFILSNPIDACSEIDPIVDATANHPVVLVAHRGNCRFDIKSKFAQQAGARILIVIDVEDNALQRMGGLQPDVGYVGIPSVLVTAEAGKTIHEFLNGATTAAQQSHANAWVEFLPAEDTSGFDHWLEVAYTTWAADATEKVLQLQGLIQKYQDTENKDIVQWLRRRLESLQSTNKEEL